MISLKSILEGESNTDMFTFKQKDAVGVRPSYQNTKAVRHNEVCSNRFMLRFFYLQIQLFSNVSIKCRKYSLN